MRLLPFLEQIRNNTTTLVAVKPASGLSAVDDIESETPTCFVHPVDEIAQSNDVLGGTSQHIVVTFATIVAAKNINECTDVEELEDARDDVKSALIGYRPDINHDFVQHVKGDILEVTANIIWWRDTYRTTINLSG